MRRSLSAVDRGTRALLPATLVAIVLTASVAPRAAGNSGVPAEAAQAPQLGLPDAPRNLQVLPGDMPTRAVVGVMRGFASALGVGCTHCHVGDDPNNLDSIDFAADSLETKAVARIMLGIVETLNSDLLGPRLAEVGREAPARVGCATCHHGSPRPVTLGEVLSAAFQDGGIGAMLSRYDELRERYYGRWTYDFGEGALLGLADQLVRTGNMEAAMAAIDKNLEVYPASFSAHVSRGQILSRAGDVEGALAAFRACLAANPEISFCQSQIDRLQER